MATNKDTPAQRSVKVALIRLDPNHPEFTAAPHVEHVLRDPALHIYLETWVMPHLRYAAGLPQAYGGERDELRRDSFAKVVSIRESTNNQE